MRVKICKQSKLSTENKLTLYKQIIRPILTYSAPVYLTGTKHNFHSLQMVQNKCLRMAIKHQTPYPHFSKISWLHDKADLPTIKDFVTKI